ncbi:exported protein of unknown function [Streptantibioticus cattleyicolor NRRL 8057 = DSM 46488]|nr:exported protein of unknown function [Streptantibioticus cattleyicolor NRRL 8057 = DSM 46488]
MTSTTAALWCRRCAVVVRLVVEGFTWRGSSATLAGLITCAGGTASGAAPALGESP